MEIRVARAEQRPGDQVANAKAQDDRNPQAEREQVVRTSKSIRNRRTYCRTRKDPDRREKSAAFLKESEVKQAERDMRIKLADADASAIEGENKAKAVIANSDAELEVREAEAFSLGKPVNARPKRSCSEPSIRRKPRPPCRGRTRRTERRAELLRRAPKSKNHRRGQAVAEQKRIEAEGKPGQLRPLREEAAVSMRSSQRRGRSPRDHQRLRRRQRRSR